MAWSSLLQKKKKTNIVVSRKWINSYQTPSYHVGEPTTCKYAPLDYLSVALIPSLIATIMITIRKKPKDKFFYYLIERVDVTMVRLQNNNAYRSQTVCFWVDKGRGRSWFLRLFTRLFPFMQTHLQTNRFFFFF